MKLKPSSSFYFISIVTIVLGLMIGGFMIARALMPTDIVEFEIGEEINVELSSESFVSLYLEDDLEDVQGYYEEGIYYFDITTTQTDLTLRVSIIDVDSMTEFEENSADAFEPGEYYIEDFINFGDINVHKEGNFRITVNSDNSIEGTLGYTVNDFNTMITQVVAGIGVMGLGTIIGIINWIIVFVKRSKSRKAQVHPGYNSPVGTKNTYGNFNKDYVEENKKEMEDQYRDF